MRFIWPWDKNWNLLSWSVKETPSEIVMTSTEWKTFPGWGGFNSTLLISGVLLILTGLLFGSFSDLRKSFVLLVGLSFILIFIKTQWKPYKILKNAFEENRIVIFYYITAKGKSLLTRPIEEVEYIKEPGTKKYKIPTFWMDARKIIIKK